MGISGDDPSFRIYIREKMHALLRLTHVVNPFLYTRGMCVCMCMCVCVHTRMCVCVCVYVCVSVGEGKTESKIKRGGPRR